MAKTNTNDTQKGVGLHARRVIAYVVLIIMSVLVLRNDNQRNQIKRRVTIRIYRNSKYPFADKLEQSGTWNASNLVWNV